MKIKALGQGMILWAGMKIKKTIFNANFHTKFYYCDYSYCVPKFHTKCGGNNSVYSELGKFIKCLNSWRSVSIMHNIKCWCIINGNTYDNMASKYHRKFRYSSTMTDFCYFFFSFRLSLYAYNFVVCRSLYWKCNHQIFL